MKKKKRRIYTRLLTLLTLLTALLSLTGCHGSRGLEAFQIPEAFDLTRDY